MRALSTKLYVLKSLARASAVATLANSAGCRLIGPSDIHEREPLISWAINGVIINTTSSTMYIGYAYVSYVRASVRSTTKPSTRPSPIQRSCLPENSSKESIDALSKS